MTSSYQTTLTWARQTPDFSYDTFDRTHTLKLSPQVEIQSSSAAEYAGNADLANPELLIAGALSTCHMLTFLAICAKSRLVVNGYTDTAVAELGKKDDGRIAVTRITLNPKVIVTGKQIGRAHV